MEFFDHDILNGYVSIYQRQITFNSKLLKYFEDCLKVRVGFEVENRKIYVFLLDADHVKSGEIKESSLLSVKTSKTYARISSTNLMRQISKALNIVFDDKPVKYETTWDDNQNILVIHTGK